MADNISWQEKLALLAGSLPEGENAPEPVPAEKTPARKCGKLSLFYEKKGRAGKPVTIITGFDTLSDSELSALASEIKKKLGTGGSARGGEILVQGDRQAEVRAFLKDKGFRI